MLSETRSVRFLRFMLTLGVDLYLYEHQECTLLVEIVTYLLIGEIPEIL